MHIEGKMTPTNIQPVLRHQVKSLNMPNIRQAKTENKKYHRKFMISVTRADYANNYY